jgi:hypothetical protein
MEDSVLITECFEEAVDDVVFCGQVIILDKSCYASISLGTEVKEQGGLIVSMSTKFNPMPVIPQCFLPECTHFLANVMHSTLH